MRGLHHHLWVAGIVAVLIAPWTDAHAQIAVSVSPGYSQLVLGQTLQFTATVTGSSNTAVVWQVNNANGGAAASGTISASGLYTPPSTLPVPAIATITAVSVADPAASATSTVTLLTRAPAGQTFYVAPNGNDNGPGSMSNPWATIQHAANTAEAGDTVLVEAGTYNALATFPNSGNATAGYITFESYPGETATIDGTGLPIPGGQAGLFTLNNASYVIIQGFQFQNYATSKLSQVPIGIYITGAGSNVQIIDNVIHDIDTNAKTNPSQCGSDAFGMTVYGTKAPQAIEALAVAGNEIYDTQTGCSETLSVDGNVEDFAIVSNLIHDVNNIGIDAIGFERVSPNPAYDQARDGEIRGNTVFNITSYDNPDYGKQYAADGIYVDGGTNITIEQNLVHNVDLGIELASEHKNHVTSYVTARNNVVYSDNANGISIGGYSGGVGGTDHCTIVNNTLYGNDTKQTGSGEFQIQFHATNNIFENNILYAGPQNLFVNDFTKSEPDPATVDYNLYYAAAGAANGNWVWQGKTYVGYTNYLSKTGLDSDSPPFSDPQFISLATPPDLDIEPTSPATGVGDLLGTAITGTVDFLGNPRVQNGIINLGAYEQ
jgi:parallel beta-helix repeat protein